MHSYSIFKIYCYLASEYSSHIPNIDRTGTCTVVIQVVDVNDVRPRWVQPEWRFSVPEDNPPNSLLATIPVTDPDGTNQLAYRVSSPGDHPCHQS